MPLIAGQTSFLANCPIILKFLLDFSWTQSSFQMCLIHRIVSEEIFGPVTCLEFFDDDDEAISLANAEIMGWPLEFIRKIQVERVDFKVLSRPAMFG